VGLAADDPHRGDLSPCPPSSAAGGSLFDSVLGATVQAMYFSPVRHKETEKRIDPDGTPNQHIRGWGWMDNDMVNFISSAVGAGIAALLYQLFFL
jgi:uncharacterized membrane protein